MTTAFSDSFSDAMAWHALKQSRHGAAGSARTDALKPSLSLFQVFRVPANETTRTGVYRDVVEEVVARRCQLVRQNKGVPTVLKQEMGGRVLALDLSSTMYDSVAKEITNGYFDESDAPPWDTWLGLVVCGNAVAGDDLFPLLLSWIPESDLELAQTGIEVCPSGCLSWVPDAARLIDLSPDLRVPLAELLGQGE